MMKICRGTASRLPHLGRPQGYAPTPIRLFSEKNPGVSTHRRSSAVSYREFVFLTPHRSHDCQQYNRSDERRDDAGDVNTGHQIGSQK